MTPNSIPQLFLNQVRNGKDAIALRRVQAGVFSESYTWNEWALNVSKTARALKQHGLGAGDKVGIMAHNCPAWTFVDLAVLSLGAVLVPVYPTSSVEDLTYIANDSEMKFIFVDEEERAQKVKSIPQDPLSACMVSFESVSDSLSVKTFRDFIETDSEPIEAAQSIEELSRDVKLEDLATLIYTSGTTGRPKGVMLTHSNFIENVKGSAERIKIDETDISISFLPLSHVFERMAGYYFMIYSGATICYAENMKTVAEDIKIVMPTVATAVPRFYEKVYAAIMEKLEKAPPLRRRIFEKALAVGKEVMEIGQRQEKINFMLGMQHKFFDQLVFKKIRSALGGRLRFFISGGAPLSKDLGEFFCSAGVLILEGYGLTETSPVIAVNTPQQFKFGTVGQILPNVEVKISSEGEILTSGPCVMSGYYNNAEATQKSIQDGWFHTGDIGEIDEQGYLKITDRMKDIIVTAGGKNIAPQKIEKMIIRDPLFQQAVIIGDKRPYIVALLVLDAKKVEERGRLLGISFENYEALIQEDSIKEWIQEKLDAQTDGLARYEAVKYFHILPHELTQEAGDLTPTLKVKRKAVTEKYSEAIDRLYELGASFSC